MINRSSLRKWPKEMSDESTCWCVLHNSISFVHKMNGCLISCAILGPLILSTLGLKEYSPRNLHQTQKPFNRASIQCGDFSCRDFCVIYSIPRRCCFFWVFLAKWFLPTLVSNTSPCSTGFIWLRCMVFGFLSLLFYSRHPSYKLSCWRLSIDSIKHVGRDWSFSARCWA